VSKTGMISLNETSITKVHETPSVSVLFFPNVQCG